MSWPAVLFSVDFWRFTLLLLLHHSGKLGIPHDHVFLLLQIMYLVLFKSLQRQGKLSISGYSHVVFWWDRDGYRRLSFLRRANLPFIWNGFVEIYSRPIFGRQFRKIVLVVLQQCGKDCVVIGGRSTPFEILICAIDLVYDAQCERKSKR